MTSARNEKRVTGTHDRKERGAEIISLTATRLSCKMGRNEIGFLVAGFLKTNNFYTPHVRRRFINRDISRHVFHFIARVIHNLDPSNFFASSVNYTIFYSLNTPVTFPYSSQMKECPTLILLQ